MSFAWERYYAVVAKPCRHPVSCHGPFGMPSKTVFRLCLQKCLQTSSYLHDKVDIQGHRPPLANGQCRPAGGDGTIPGGRPPDGRLAWGTSTCIGWHWSTRVGRGKSLPEAHGTSSRGWNRRGPSGFFPRARALWKEEGNRVFAPPPRPSQGMGSPLRDFRPDPVRQGLPAHPFRHAGPSSSPANRGSRPMDPWR